MTLLLGFNVAAGLLLAGLSVPLIRGMVGPNSWYGFRVRRTLDDPAVWYLVNAYAAKGLLCVGLTTCAASAFLYLIPGIGLDVYALSVAAVSLGGLAINLILSFRYLRSIPKRDE